MPFLHYPACVLSHFSCVWLFATQWTEARQAPLPMESSRQEYCSGLPGPPPGGLPNPGVEPRSPPPAVAGGFFATSTSWEALLALARLCILCWTEVGRVESLPCFQSEKVKVAQSCPTVCGPMDYTVHGLLQARILEWGAFPFSRGSCQPRDRAKFSHIAGRFFTTEKHLILH